MLDPANKEARDFELPAVAAFFITGSSTTPAGAWSSKRKVAKKSPRALGTSQTVISTVGALIRLLHAAFSTLTQAEIAFLCKRWLFGYRLARRKRLGSHIAVFVFEAPSAGGRHVGPGEPEHCDFKVLGVHDSGRFYASLLSRYCALKV